MVPTYSLASLLLFSKIVFAANNWNTPCLSGQCSFDLNNSTVHGTARGSLTISGSTNAVSDLTTAAGWTVLDCDADTGAQDIRAVCTGDNSTCSHVYQNGIVGTIVRLPDNCGKMPFARVAAEWTSENQTVPEAVAQKLRRRSEPAIVRGITLDTQFHQINPSHHGQVTMLVQGATGLNSTAALPSTPSNSTLNRRGLFSSILKALSFNVDKSETQSISVNHPFTLIDKTEQCTVPGNTHAAFTAGLKVDVNAAAQATVNYGVVAQGSIVPPKVSEFGLFADFDAELDGTLDITASAKVSLSSGQVTIFQAGLPGLDFPGILTLGPSFEVNALATAAVEADAQLSVGLAYTITGAKLYFPPNAGSSLGTFAPSDTKLALSANPSVSGSGNVQAHLIPTLLFGINALGGLADADVNLNLDTFAELDLSLSKSATSPLTGCTDVKTGLSVNAGASGSFFGLFSKSTTVSLFSKTFTLFQKCFSTGLRRDHARALPSPLFNKRLSLPAGITCTNGTSSGTTLTTITSETVPANSIQ